MPTVIAADPMRMIMTVDIGGQRRTFRAEQIRLLAHYLRGGRETTTAEVWSTAMNIISESPDRFEEAVRRNWAGLHRAGEDARAREGRETAAEVSNALDTVLGADGVQGLIAQAARIVGAEDGNGPTREQIAEYARKKKIRIPSRASQAERMMRIVARDQEDRGEGGTPELRARRAADRVRDRRTEQWAEDGRGAYARSDIPRYVMPSLGSAAGRSETGVRNRLDLGGLLGLGDLKGEGGWDIHTPRRLERGGAAGGGGPDLGQWGGEDLSGAAPSGGSNGSPHEPGGDDQYAIEVGGVKWPLFD
jgi:hypothetical protein